MELASAHPKILKPGTNVKAWLEADSDEVQVSLAFVDSDGNLVSEQSETLYRVVASGPSASLYVGDIDLVNDAAPAAYLQGQPMSPRATDKTPEGEYWVEGPRKGTLKAAFQRLVSVLPLTSYSIALLRGRCDDPTALLLSSLERSSQVFTLLLGLEDTLKESRSEIGSSTRSQLERGREAAFRAIRLIKDGPPFPPELGPLTSDVSFARQSLRHITEHFERGRLRYVLSGESGWQYLDYKGAEAAGFGSQTGFGETPVT